MIKRIVVEIRCNETNMQCTDAECDCSFLRYSHEAGITYCGLFQGSVEDGAVLRCLEARQKTDFFVNSIVDDATIQPGVIQKVKELLGVKHVKKS